MATLQKVLEPAVLPEAGDDEDLQEAPGDVSDSISVANEPPKAAATRPIDFMAGIQVQRMDDGRLVLEAKPEAAAAFASMLEGVAAMLKQLAPP